jgi:hypothetical protein
LILEVFDHLVVLAGRAAMAEIKTDNGGQNRPQRLGENTEAAGADNEQIEEEELTPRPTLPA